MFLQTCISKLDSYQVVVPTSQYTFEDFSSETICTCSCCNVLPCKQLSTVCHGIAPAQSWAYNLPRDENGAQLTAGLGTDSITQGVAVAYAVHADPTACYMMHKQLHACKFALVALLRFR